MMLRGRRQMIHNLVSTILAFMGQPDAPQKPPRQQQETNSCCETTASASASASSPRPFASPPGVDYSRNPTVFGDILRGELPCQTYLESKDLLSFRDKTPRAPLHALVIPKRYVPTVRDLAPTPDDVELVSSMKEMALDVLRSERPDAYRIGDYVLCFHVPPFNSVNHLHLHVLAPASDMTILMRYGKYLLGSPWCTAVDDILIRLERGDAAV